MLLSPFAGAVTGFNSGLDAQRQRSAQDALLQQQLGQQQAIENALGGFLSGSQQIGSGIGTLGAPVNNQVGQLSPVQNATPVGGNAVISGINQNIANGTLSGGVQPQQSPIPQQAPTRLSDISIQDVSNQALQLKSQVDNNLLRLAAVPNVPANLLNQAQAVGQNQVDQFRQTQLAPLENAVNAIQQVMLTDGVERARRVANEVVESSGDQNRGILSDSLGLSGSDEEFQDKLLLAANAFGLGEDIRKQRVNAAGAGLAARAQGQAELDTEPDRVVTVGNKDIISRNGKIDPSTGVTANNIQLQQLKEANKSAGGNVGPLLDVSAALLKEFDVDSVGEALAENDVTKLKRIDKGSKKRANTIIDDGLDAARGIPVVRRSLELLTQIDTGGIDSVALRAKQIFGVEGADEGELSANLGKAVLSQLRATFGAAFTENEGKRLERIEAGFGKSNETNIRLLSNLETFLEAKVESAKVRAENQEDFDTIKDIERFEALDFNPVRKDSSTNSQTVPASGSQVGRFIIEVE